MFVMSYGIHSEVCRAKCLSVWGLSVSDSISDHKVSLGFIIICYRAGRAGSENFTMKDTKI